MNFIEEKVKKINTYIWNRNQWNKCVLDLVRFIIDVFTQNKDHIDDIEKEMIWWQREDYISVVKEAPNVMAIAPCMTRIYWYNHNETQWYSINHVISSTIIKYEVWHI